MSEGSDSVRYVRQLRREGSLRLQTKIFQGSGGMPDALKQFAFNTFLLFYYNRVLEMSASLVSLALLIALLVDAVTDPFAGSFSDRLKTNMGRRHPLMFASVPLLVVGLYCLFAPLQGLDELQLFIWLLVFTVTTRIGMTLFVVPWEAMFAELTPDYAERNVLLTYKYLFVWVASATIGWASWNFVFPSTDAYTPGHLNPDAYDLFAMSISLSVGIAALITTLLTRREIPYLLQPLHKTSTINIGRTLVEIKQAIRNKDFLIIISCALIASAVTGALLALEIYMHTYFWGLGPDEIRWFALSISGFILAFALTNIIRGRMDKKKVLMISFSFTIVESGSLVCLRFADLLPDNGDSKLLVLLVASMVVRVALLTLTGVCAYSMVADCVDVQELETGRRQEGMFSAALQFSAKVSTGMGVFLSGLVIAWLSLPEDSSVVQLSKETLLSFGLVVGVGIPALQVIPLFLISRYSLTASRHGDVVQQLQSREYVH